MKPTASSFALLHACQYSFREDVSCPPSEPSDEATRGTMFGQIVETYINKNYVMQQVGVDPLPPTESARLAAMKGHAIAWLDANRRAGWIAERLFSWNPRTDVGREWFPEPDPERRWYDDPEKRAKYGVDPDELFARLDIVGTEGEAEDTILVQDWKSTIDGAPTADAADQLEGGALFAARALNCDQARIRTLRVTEDGVTPIEGDPIDMFALAAIAERLASDVARIPGAEPVPGDWCKGRYCKAISVCPETSRAMAPALVPATALLKRYPFTAAIESPDHLQALIQMRSMVDAASEAVKRAITAYVGDREIQCSDGMVIKATFKTMPRESRAELLEAFKSLGGTQEQLDACWHPRVESAGIKAIKPRKGKVA